MNKVAVINISLLILLVWFLHWVIECFRKNKSGIIVLKGNNIYPIANN